MIHHARCVVTALGLGLLSAFAHAQATPVGLWKTIDDHTKKERSLIRISESAGVLTGRIEKSLDPDAKAGELCEKCTDDRKDKPLIGMALIRNTKQNPNDKAIWDGGDITDPDNGKTYKLRLKPQDGGKTLEVRGYIGPFYRNQTWLRVE
jgi:uncharacterized protein (DUF2147 family)